MEYNQFTSESQEDQDISIGSPPPQIHAAPQQQIYVPQPQMYAPQQQIYMPQQQIHVPQQQVYAPQQQMYAPQQQVYAPQQQEYAPQQQVYVPQQQVYAPQRPHANILQGPEYRLHSAQKTVRNWSFCLKLFASLCIIGGVLKITGDINGMLDIEDELYVEDLSDETEVIPVDDEGLYATSALDICHGILNLILGYCILKAVEDQKSQSSLRLFKITVIMIIIHSIILTIQFIIAFGIYGDALEDWKEDREAGEYTVRVRDEQGSEYNHKYNENYQDGHKDSESEIDFAEDYSDSVIIFMIILFSIICCIMSCCSMCTLGLIYKLHDATKQLEFAQTQLTSSVPNVSVSASEIGNNFYNGKFVNMPVSNIQ